MLTYAKKHSTTELYFQPYLSVCSFGFFEAELHDVVKGDLELTMKSKLASLSLLPQPSECWNYKYLTLFLVNKIKFHKQIYQQELHDYIYEH